MDSADRELIRLLSRNARMPAAELARELGVSRSTVQNRIDRLLANGTIARFTVELGQESESPLVRAVVLIKLASGDSRKTVAQFRRTAGVETVTSINGTYDFFLEVTAASLPQLDKILQGIRMLPQVTETNSSICMDRFK